MMGAPSEIRPPLLGGKTAVVLAGVFLAAFALFAVLVAVDRAHRPQLEALDSPSAAGDPAVVPFPQSAALPETSVLVRAGVPHFLVCYEGVHDDEMRKADADDAGKIPIYRRQRSQSPWTQSSGKADRHAI